MATRIEVGFKEGIRDALGEKTRKRIIDNLALAVAKVATIEVYTVAGELSVLELQEAAEGPLSDPVIQEFSINSPLAKKFDWLIEVGFRPGVTDNVGKTAREAITLLLGDNIGSRKVSVYTSRQFLISGKISKADVEKIASGLLANDLIERHQVVGVSDFDFSRGLPAYIPQVLGKDEPQVAQINLAKVDAQGLLKISQEKLLALNLEEMQKIQAYYQNPVVLKARKKFGLDENTTDVELECLAQTWSEHCKHKIFNSKIDYTDGRNKLKIDSLFKKYIKGSTTKIRKAKGKNDIFFKKRINF
jgi:phosphoribosylformylglycinamidine (FGAM) synthase PurS component